MLTRVYNQDNLDESQIDRTVRRVKTFILNSKEELLVGYSSDSFQLVGGHVESGESLEQALLREVLEESGIELPPKEYEPFYLSKKYYKDYPTAGTNSCYEIYFYFIETDEKPDIRKIKLTQNEKSGNYSIKKVDLYKIEKAMQKNIERGGVSSIIAKETLEALEVYRQLSKKEQKQGESGVHHTKK